MRLLHYAPDIEASITRLSARIGETCPHPRLAARAMPLLSQRVGQWVVASGLEPAHSAGRAVSDLRVCWHLMLVGDYGLWTMGMIYALALILPIVTTFFLAFGVLEDSGYLPRLSVVTNRLFAVIGLNGRAVLAHGAGLGLRDHGHTHHAHPLQSARTTHHHFFAGPGGSLFGAAWRCPGHAGWRRQHAGYWEAS